MKLLEPDCLPFGPSATLHQSPNTSGNYRQTSGLIVRTPDVTGINPVKMAAEKFAFFNINTYFHQTKTMFINPNFQRSLK